jgi:carbon-monoxide dehydrogenase small subunit
VIAVGLTVNGLAVELTVEARTLLVELLREHLRLTGTHVGCDTSQCGCCTVHLNGRSVKSCTVLAAQADGAEVTTIEGIADRAGLHPLQRAFREHHALQCGFCTPGMILRGLDILNEYPDADVATIERELAGNFCRCTGYTPIVDAIRACAVAARGNSD